MRVRARVRVGVRVGVRVRYLVKFAAFVFAALVCDWLLLAPP